MAHRQGYDVVSRLEENLRGLLNGLAGATDNGLAIAIDVGDHHVASDRFQNSLDFFNWRKDSRHPAIVFHRDPSHFAPAGTDGFQRVRKGQSASGNQRSVFTEAMPHGHVGLDAVGSQEPREREVGGQDGWLSDGGLAQIVFGFGNSAVVSLVNKDKFGEGLAEQWSHYAVRFGKSFRHYRFDGAQTCQHVDVLRALARIEEGNPGSGTAAAEDALCAQSFPHC